MKIQILELIEGAKAAEGLTVIIDVFRAFSFECYLYSLKAASVIPVGSVEEAKSLKEANPGYILTGERGGRKCEGFDYGNSPSQVIYEDLAGKTIIHTTSAGTQGIVNARNADEIITGSLVNAKAIASYIKKRNPEKVSLVAMGKNGTKSAREDVLCAEYIKSLVEGTDYNIRAGVLALRQEGGQRFFDPETQDVYPEADFWLCTDYNKFPFVLRVDKKADGSFESVKVNNEA